MGPDRPKVTQPGGLCCPPPPRGRGALPCSALCVLSAGPSASGVSASRPLHSSFYSLAEEDWAQKAVGGWPRADEPADSSCQQTKRHREAWKTGNVREDRRSSGSYKQGKKTVNPAVESAKLSQSCLAPSPCLQQEQTNTKGLVREHRLHELRGQGGRGNRVFQHRQ